jgi:SAM-dependent methyltransferase
MLEGLGRALAEAPAVRDREPTHVREPQAQAISVTLASGSARTSRWRNVSYRKGYIDKTPCGDASADAVISNGVINLVPDKAAVFREAARLLKAGGRLAVADIVTDVQLPETVTCNADLWAACIGGAMQRDGYRAAIEGAGLRIKSVCDNAGYRFISENARGAQQRWGVKSISLLAVKP